MQSQPRGRVLIVDDDRRVASGLREYLTRYLLYVRVAHSVEEALLEVAQDCFDVIVLDWILPDGDGRKVLETVRSVSAETVTIVYSAHPTSDSECSALRSDQFVLKGHDTSAIRNAVERGLAKSRELHVLKPESDEQDSHRDLWKIVYDAIGGKASEDHQVLVRAPYADLATRFACWLLKGVVDSLPLIQVDSRQRDASSFSPAGLFGTCQLDGPRNSKSHRGIVDVPLASHILFKNAERLPSDCIDSLSRTLASRSFHRVGTDRTLELKARISFAVATGTEDSSDRPLESLVNDFPLVLFDLPNSPLDILGADEWIIRLTRSDNSLDRSSDGICKILKKLSPSACWKALFEMSECRSEINDDEGSRMMWLTQVPLYESTLASAVEGDVVAWKSIADVPRQLYVAWILSRTGGNVTEASRLSGLTRAAIYNTLRET